MASENLKKAQAKAAMPEARAKAVATRKRRQEEALLKHAKMVTTSIPLDMIPDKPYRKKTKPWSLKKLRQQESEAATRQEVVLALLKYLNGE